MLIRLQPGNASVQDFLLMQRVPSVSKYFTLSEATVCGSGIVCSTAADVAIAIRAGHL
jgi:hypothetical protein